MPRQKKGYGQKGVSVVRPPIARKGRRNLADQRTADDLAAQIVPPILVLVALFVAVCFISAESTGFFGSGCRTCLRTFSSAAYTIPVFIIIIAAFDGITKNTEYTPNSFSPVYVLCVACLSQTGGPDTFNKSSFGKRASNAMAAE